MFKFGPFCGRAVVMFTNSLLELELLPFLYDSSWRPAGPFAHMTGGGWGGVSAP
jgi:hypothetical protein